MAETITIRIMKTSLKIMTVVMTITAVWSACQMDVQNMALAAASLPILVLAIYHPKIKS